ncbi:MAG: hypothetical protein ONB12_08045 [candidate division KSB1 bacterium]|nr:hypothetical protein [candidate division KSB1 bacterium]
MMLDFESNLWEQEFETSLQKTLQICDTLLLKNAADAEALFYRGGALSYYGLHFSRSGKYWQGISYSIRAVRTLQKVLEIDDSWNDVYLAIGCYKYWRSYLTRIFSWLPFFADQREEGIQDIKKAYRTAKFSKWPALSNLGWIYMQEKEYSLAEKCADEGLSAFPKSRFFLWLKAEAAAKQQRIKEAAELYQLLLDSVTAQKFNNHFNEIVLHLKLAHCFAALQETQKACLHARKAAELQPQADAPPRVLEKQNEAKKLLQSLEKQSP